MTKKVANDLKNEKDFVKMFDDIFYFSHADPLNIIKIKNYDQFCIA